jgi:hypothetical protein
VLTLQFVALLGAAVLVPTGAILIALGLFRSGSTAPEAAAGELVPHPIPRSTPPDHRSTDAERQECRVRLGPSYDAHLVIVADVLARRPAALRGVLMELADLPIDDLVTVSAYLTGPPIGLNRALRHGTAEMHRSVIACLTSGLNKLPVHQGVCFGVARTVGIPLDVYRPGRTIIEPAFIQAHSEWSTTWCTGTDAVDTEIIFAFWSRTGRQVGSLATRPDTVVFAAGTKFRVLGSQDCQSGDGPGVVFLSECPRFGSFAREWPLARFGLGKRRILARLRHRVSTEIAKPSETVRQPTTELGFTPGFDQTGRPYQEDLNLPTQSALR